jgi:hypothetical protein
VPRFLRIFALGLVVIASGVAGFVVVSSTPESGGLETAYRHALMGAACGLAIGIVLAFALASLVKARRPS